MNSKKNYLHNCNRKTKSEKFGRKKKKSTEVNQMSSNFLRMKQNYNMACCSYCPVLGMPWKFWDGKSERLFGELPTYHLLVIYLLSIYLSITYQSCILYVVFTFLTLFHSKQMKNRGLTFLQRFCSRIHTFTITLKYCSFYYWLVCPNFSPKSFATLEPIAWTSPVLLPPTSATHFPCPFSGNTTSNICV